MFYVTLCPPCTSTLLSAQSNLAKGLTDNRKRDPQKEICLLHGRSVKLLDISKYSKGLNISKV